MPTEPQIIHMSVSLEWASSLVNMRVLIHLADCPLAETNTLEHHNLVTLLLIPPPSLPCSHFVLTKDPSVTFGCLGFLKKRIGNHRA